MIVPFESANPALWNDLTFLKIVSDLCGLPAVLWVAGEDQIICGKPLAAHPCESDAVFRRTLEEHCHLDKPAVYFENDYVFWGIMQVSSFFIALGPAVFTTASKEYEIRYASDHAMAQPIPVKKTAMANMTQYMDLLFCHFQGSAVPYEEVAYQGGSTTVGKWASIGDLEEYQLDQSENDRSHRSGIDFEAELMELVRKGDPEALKQLIGGMIPDVSEIGVIVDEKNKEMEYMVVSLVTLMTRAAIDGGVRAETAHEFGDVYLKQLAAKRSRGEPFTMLGYKAMVEFAELVASKKKEKRSTSYVEACKDYIEKNLRKDIAVSDIAPAIGLSRTYLSHLFREAEGITIQEYICREKCRHAARMLRYSDYSVAMIAQYFGFSSQSYFGTCFRQYSGMAPSEYRTNAHN